jgi:hypothetical protein
MRLLLPPRQRGEGGIVGQPELFYGRVNAYRTQADVSPRPQKLSSGYVFPLQRPHPRRHAGGEQLTQFQAARVIAWRTVAIQPMDTRQWFAVYGIPNRRDEGRVGCGHDRTALMKIASGIATQKNMNIHHAIKFSNRSNMEIIGLPSFQNPRGHEGGEGWVV